MKPDTDNLLKAFCDAMTPDDSVIWKKQGTKYWGRKGFILVVRNEFVDNLKFDSRKLNIVLIEEFEQKLENNGT